MLGGEKFKTTAFSNYVTEATITLNLKGGHYKMKTIRKHLHIIIIYVIMLMGLVNVAQADMVIDNFDAGDIIVNQSETSTWGNLVPGVFGGRRSILIDKADESSATSMTINSGVLTWTQTSRNDYGHIGLGDTGTSIDISAYNAFSINVVSAPQDAGKLEIDFSYYGSPMHSYGIYAYAALPSDGTVVIPFSSLDTVPTFPPVDFTKVNNIGLTFRGMYLNSGAYVVDDFKLTSIATPVAPEPISSILFVIGGTLLAGRRYIRRKA